MSRESWARSVSGVTVVIDALLCWLQSEDALYSDPGRLTPQSASFQASWKGTDVPHRLCERPLPAVARRHGPCRGSRLSVLRRRLRGLRGEGRAHGRRAPAHGAARALASANCASPCRCRRRRSASSCARPSARNRVSNGIVYLQITRGVARRDHAFPPAGHGAGVVVTARSLDGAGNEAMADKGIAVVTVPDNRWAPRRHQVDLAAAQRAGQAGGARAGRARGLVRGPGRARDRRLLQQCLDRDRRREGGHPRRRHARSCAASPATC